MGCKVDNKIKGVIYRILKYDTNNFGRHNSLQVLMIEPILPKLLKNKCFDFLVQKTKGIKASLSQIFKSKNRSNSKSERLGGSDLGSEYAPSSAR